MYNKQLTSALTVLLQTRQFGEIDLLCLPFLFGLHSISGPGLDSMLPDIMSLDVTEELLQ